MEAHPRTLRTVFRSDVRLTVPLFQRPYVWDAATQWQPLWEDVQATRERGANGDTVPHFLGAIVLEHKPAAHGSLETREVIDGQQRLTTLQLLIAAIRDAYQERFPSAVMVKRLTKLLENDPDLVDLPEERHKLWPTNRDRAAYRAVMTGEYRDTPYAPSLPRIPGAYAWFRDAIAASLASSSEAEAETALGGLAEVMFERLEVVVIDLGPADNAQVIFETLNARGTALRASDLIKNLLFRTLQEAGGPIENLYEKHWQPLEGESWQHEVRQGRLTRPRLDAFMGYFLVILMQREVQAHQLFPTARAFVGQDAHRAMELLKEASRYAEVYERLEGGQSDDPLERASLARMQIVDTTTMTPLLLWLFGNTSGSDRRHALLALESYVVRRSLCRLTTKNYNRLFLELLRRLGSGEGPAGEVVPSYLAGQGSDSGIWPPDAEVEHSLLHMPLYRLLKRERLQRVLLALEVQATTDLSEPIAAQRKLSVEHLLPQSWEDHWPLPSAPALAEAVRDQRSELLHTIGNLTLITGSLNSTISNGPWETKRRHLLEHSALTLNRSLPERWDETAISERSAHLARIATQLWPRPTPLPGADLFASASERDLRPDRDNQAAPIPPTRIHRENSSGGRRDIGAHIQHAFDDRSPGEFLTISQIRATFSPEYAGTTPSAGAISYRLFPPNGTSTVPGVRPDTRNGVRGAVKLADQ